MVAGSGRGGPLQGAWAAVLARRPTRRGGVQPGRTRGSWRLRGVGRGVVGRAVAGSRRGSGAGGGAGGGESAGWALLGVDSAPDRAQPGGERRAGVRALPSLP